MKRLFVPTDTFPDELDMTKPFKFQARIFASGDVCELGTQLLAGA